MTKFNKIHPIIFLFIIFLPVSILTGSFLLNLLSILISVYVLYFILKNRYYNLIYNKQNIYLFILFISFIISSIISDYPLTSLESSLAYLSNILMFVGLSFLALEGDDKKLLLSRIIFTITIFLCLDLWVQKIFGNNIFGFPQQQAGRLTSIFKDEQIPGGIIFKLIPFVIYYLFKTTNLILVNTNFLYLFLFIFLF